MNLIRRVFRLLPPLQRRRLPRVAACVLLRALLDFAGVAALVPVLLAVLGRGEGRTAMLVVCGAALVFVAAKNGLVMVLARRQTRFQLDIYNQLSRRMFTNYYRRGMAFLKGRSSVQLAHEVNHVCYAFSLAVIAPLLRMAGDAVLALLMVAALAVWKPLAAALLCAVLVPLAAIYAGMVRKRLRQAGLEELEARRRLSRTVTEAFRGYAELEVAQAFGSSLDTFDRGMDEIARSRLRMETCQLCPSFLSEAALVGGLALLAAAGGGDTGLTGGVFAVAAFRLIPAARNILTCWAALQNAAHTIDVVEEGVAEEEEDGEAAFLYTDRQLPLTTDRQRGETYDRQRAVTYDRHLLLTIDGQKMAADTLTFDHSIELRNISFAFPDGQLLFDGFSLEIRRGERIGIRGPSGAGKSTLFNLMLGFLQPTAGEILIDGRQLTPQRRDQWHRLVGYVPQEVFIAEGTLAENIALGQPRPDRERVARALEQVRLDEWASALPQGLDTPLGEYGSRLSGGQKQRVGIARALYKGATVLFLDEATSALDSQTESEVNAALRRLAERHSGLTVIAIAHRESSLQFCDRVVEIGLPGRGQRG